VAIGLVLAAPLRAQDPSYAIGSAFVQASVTPNTSDDRMFYPMSMTDGRFKATNMRLRQLIVKPAPGPPGPPVAVIGPGLFRAMEEQLGLGLASETGPVTFLVIEHLEKPGGN
jgi:hypothetical protein